MIFQLTAIQPDGKTKLMVRHEFLLEELPLMFRTRSLDQWWSFIIYILNDITNIERPDISTCLDNATWQSVFIELADIKQKVIVGYLVVEIWGVLPGP